MATFRCTKKLLDHLGAKPVPESDLSQAKSTLGDWYANVMTVDRRKVVLWTNEQTLFSFVMLKVRAKRPDLFYAGFLHGMSMALELEGIPPQHIDSLLHEHEGLIQFTKTKNRSVVASMNQIGQDFEHIIWYNHGFKYCEIGKVVHSLNNTPWKAIGFNFASRLVRERLENGCQ